MTNSFVLFISMYCTKFNFSLPYSLTVNYNLIWFKCRNMYKTVVMTYLVVGGITLIYNIKIWIKYLSIYYNSLSKRFSVLIMFGHRSIKIII